MSYIGDLAQLITALVVLANFIVSLLHGRKLAEVEHSMNGMKDQLVKTTGEAEFQKGLKQGEGINRP